MSSKSGTPRKMSPEKKDKKGSHRSSSSSSSPSRSKGRGNYRREERNPANVKLFVTNIDSKFTEEELRVDLQDLFTPFGKLKDIVIKTKVGSANSYCFIEYEELESAIQAQTGLKGKIFKGKELKVQFGKGERKTQDRRSDKCYICHKEGHFAKDCRYNRFNDRNQDDHRRDDRDRDRGRDRYYPDKYQERRDYRQRRDYRERRRRSYSSSSSPSPSYRHRRDRDRDDYRRHRDHRSPENRGSRNYHSNSRRYD